MKKKKPKAKSTARTTRVQSKPLNPYNLPTFVHFDDGIRVVVQMVAEEVEKCSKPDANGHICGDFGCLAAAVTTDLIERIRKEFGINICKS